MRPQLRTVRRVKNQLALGISMAAMLFGLFWLVWILATTINLGISGMSLQLFTEATPPPGSGSSCAVVVVCRPFPVASEMEPSRRR